jgi:RHS repeat-associated protein
MTSDGSASPAKFSYTERDQLAGITPHGGSETKIVSHGTGQEDLAAIGTEEVIQNVLGVASTGSGESASYYTRGSEGLLLAKRKPGEHASETQYYLLDPFGSPAMLTSATGTQTAPASGTYQYDSYGSSIGAGPSTFGYRSGQILPEGLIHYGARYYNPAGGQWIQQDPINQAEGLTQADRFAFVGDDPINNLDPNGELFDTLLKWGAEYLHAGEKFIFSEKLAQEASVGNLLDIFGKAFKVASIFKFSNECANKLTGGGLEGDDPGSCNVIHLVLP